MTRRLPAWWPLAALTLAAAVLRLSTLGLQSYWYDEAYTPVHVLHASLVQTLRWTTKTENSPPLWYIVTWLFYRIFGAGEWALRMPSALAGIALVPVAWGIGRELAGRAAAIATAALIAFGPIFVWYSQEARVYGLYALTAGVLVLCFLRMLRIGDRRRVIEFALAGAAGLLTHYFTAFLLIGMGVWLLAGWGGTELRRRSLPALGAIAVVGVALLPLIVAQGGRSTSWIGSWPLIERLEAIPGYFLVGYNGGSLGRSVELLVSLPLIAACGVGLWRLAASPPDGEGASVPPTRARAAVLMAWLAACGLAIPLLLALGGADYLAPRNALGAMIPVAALIAVLGTLPGTGRAGPALLALGICVLLALSVDVNLSPRLQRADWRGVARAVPGAGSAQTAVVTTLFGSAPLQYYMPGLVPMRPHTSVRVSEIEETAEKPLRASAGRPPAGFRLVERRSANGVEAFRFVAPAPRTLTEEQLHYDRLVVGETHVLIPGDAR